jgi:exopolysaccharide biosynthesis protein
VVLDGRQSNSIGLTLLELAKFMQELGSVDAMNLDGGGSSEMVIKGKVVNKPSDGRERRIGDALLVIPSKSAI